MTLPLASDTSLGDVILWMIIFFGFVIWIWLLITIFVDIFRRHDVSGWAKAAWIIFLIILPLIGVLAYLIFNSKGIAERNMQAAQASQSAFENEVRRVAGSDPADQIAKAHALLEKGAIDQAEFDRIKQQALAGSSGS